MNHLCGIVGHTADSIHHHNQGLDFSNCHQCGCDLIRSEGSDWAQVPRGFRVVWREFGRANDAAAVAARMQRPAAPPPPRRAPRNPPSTAPRRDRRGRPLSSAANLLVAFTQLGKLLRQEAVADDGRMDANGQYVILLPGASGNKHR